MYKQLLPYIRKSTHILGTHNSLSKWWDVCQFQSRRNLNTFAQLWKYDQIFGVHTQNAAVCIL